MPTFTGVDTEFAVSTGSNVGSGAGTSTFDNPPQGSKDLIITSNSGDPEPYKFEAGDTYDVSWGGQGGGGTMEDAVVIRSDAAPGSGGIVVLEGTDESGETVQVVWTPDFDLEGWYTDNYNPSMEPAFWTSDQDPNFTYSYVCFERGTLIKTNSGLVPVEALSLGQSIVTRDAGPVPLIWKGHKQLAGVGPNAPVRFEPGSIGNRRVLKLSQQHRVLVASPMAEYYFGSREVLVPAKAMVGVPGISMTPCPMIEYHHLLLEEHHLVIAEGALCESLLLGDVALKSLIPDADLVECAAKDATSVRHSRAARPVLTYREARLLMGTLCQPEASDGRYALV